MAVLFVQLAVRTLSQRSVIEVEAPDSLPQSAESPVSCFSVRRKGFLYSPSRECYYLHNWWNAARGSFLFLLFYPLFYYLTIRQHLAVCISFIHCLDCALTARPWLLLLLLLYFKLTREHCLNSLPAGLFSETRCLTFFLLSLVWQLILNGITVNKSDANFPL